VISVTTPREKRKSLPVLNDGRRRPAAAPRPQARPGRIHLPEGPGREEVRRVLGVLLGGLRAYRIGGAPFVFSLRSLPPAEVVALIHALGDGELTIAVLRPRAQSIRETALPGLWHVEGDALVIADVPPAVREANAEATLERPGEPAPLPLLRDLAHRAAAFRAGDRHHVVSPALVPLDEEELDLLDQWLGRGPVVAESSGLGRCRVALTAHRHIWSVQHSNGMGAILVDTLEVGDVPSAIAAAQEDFADSADRLGALLGI
jgi:hydrogenase-1 operon protein HyaF